MSEIKNYFEVKETGINSDSQVEEVKILCGENGIIYLRKTEFGFIVDVYNQMDIVDRLHINETELTPDINEF